MGNLTEVTKGNYEFRLGNHLLKGKSSDLANPILFTEKVLDDHSLEISFKIRGVIKKKILFSTRPTPLRTGATD